MMVLHITGNVPARLANQRHAVMPRSTGCPCSNVHGLSGSNACTPGAWRGDRLWILEELAMMGSGRVSSGAVHHRCLRSRSHGTSVIIVGGGHAHLPRGSTMPRRYAPGGAAPRNHDSEVHCA